jgi:hypothetical protein
MVLLSAKLHNNLKTLSNKHLEIIVTIKQLNRRTVAVHSICGHDRP